MLKAKITSCPNKLMSGTELRRLRVANDMSVRGLAGELGTYHMQIERWENLHHVNFEIHPRLMAELLNILKASSL